uniref:ATP synthase F0 subunit 8 n=1 Tax=Nothopsyche ruficollis TaxID=115141 RepID=UPI0022DCE188|nr:ATP synthase F0 subunit 8 [Nothopsyche ruficollis]UZZ44185.1 ATP synthase F0 subunit 8 [Nothopsyche ruficollis]
MPQMMPLNWTILYLMFNLIFYIFMVNNYFNINFQPHTPLLQLQSNHSQSFYNFWPLN